MDIPRIIPSRSYLIYFQHSNAGLPPVTQLYELMQADYELQGAGRMFAMVNLVGMHLLDHWFDFGRFGREQVVDNGPHKIRFIETDFGRLYYELVHQPYDMMLVIERR